MEKIVDVNPASGHWGPEDIDSSVEVDRAATPADVSPQNACPPELELEAQSLQPRWEIEPKIEHMKEMLGGGK